MTCKPLECSVTVARSNSGSSLEEIHQREFRVEAQLEGRVAELNVEIDQAGLAPGIGLELRVTNRELAKERRCPGTSGALDHRYDFAVARDDL